MKVLIAVNESEFAQSIAEYVVSQGWPAQTEFTILSVLDLMKIGSVMAVLPGPILDDLMLEHSKNAKEICAGVADTIKLGLKTENVVKVDIVEGFPKEDIVDYATTYGADEIIVGSHDRKGLQRFMLGSVSLAVVCHARCTVVVVRAKSSNK